LAALATTAGAPNIRAQSLPDDCLPKPTLPLPTCVAAVDARERAQVTLQRARAWVKSARWPEVIATLEPQLPAIEKSGDLGSLVCAYAELGNAQLALGKFDAGTHALTIASTLWHSERALHWLRSLPSGEPSQHEAQRASDAAASAVLQLGELWFRRNRIPMPTFAGWSAPLPFALKPDAALNKAQRKLREQWLSHHRNAFIRYVGQQVGPWLARQRLVVQQAQREFQQAYFVPPVASVAWRVAVAAHVGQIWWELVVAARSNQCGEACSSFYYSDYSNYSSLGLPLEAEERLAREAFEECVDLSRRFRLLTPSTLSCEHWLANTYRATYHRLDELTPTADWRPKRP
jgi:hypothetical protein